jgi:hypothetical protein
MHAFIQHSARHPSTHFDMNPEITNDSLSAMLTTLAARDDVKTVLEVGSGDGSGSTQALLSGLKGKVDCRLACLETRHERFESLKSKVLSLESRPKTFDARLSTSVPVSTWLTVPQIRDFYESHITALNRYTIEEVLAWLAGEIVHARDLPQHGIESIKSEWGVKEFDLVLLDGCPFCGVRDLTEVWGSKIIVLDDVLDIKNFENFADLNRINGEYQLDYVDMDCRNGWAVFVRKQ